jgi:serine/threonine protein kinase
VTAARYEIVRRLGSGNSTAGVFLAEHLDLGRQVAVKLLKLDSGSDRNELLREGKLMGLFGFQRGVMVESRFQLGLPA